MPFTSTETRTPTAIGKITVFVIDYDGTPANGKIVGHAEVLDQNGILIDVHKENLAAVITPAQTQALIDFMTNLRTQAESEILPPAAAGQL